MEELNCLLASHGYATFAPDHAPDGYYRPYKATQETRGPDYDAAPDAMPLEERAFFQQGVRLRCEQLSATVQYLEASYQGYVDVGSYVGWGHSYGGGFPNITLCNPKP